jgi:hypothetical protein
VGKLDRALGGTIIAAGLGSGFASSGGAALAPLALLEPIWGWVDQKNEAVGLVRSIVNRLSNKISSSSGLERRDLASSAHTIIVIAAYFEVFDEAIGKKLSKDLEISEREKARIAAGDNGSLEDSWNWLYTNEVPAPSPTRGFEENLTYVSEWLSEFSARLSTFLDGLTSWNAAGRPALSAALIRKAAYRYESHYLKLAAEVPEFAIWSFLGEHSATRAAIQRSNHNVSSALATHGFALSRIQALLEGLSNTHAEGGAGGLREVVYRANRSALHQPIVSGDVVRHEDKFVFPSLERQFVTPRFRVGSSDTGVPVADEDWWTHMEVRHDLEGFLSAYFTTSHATRLPLLVLGHPGAGKSVLAKVIAAQLPPNEYVVVRVPLRSVGANAPIIDQIQQALDGSTNRRVEWHMLSDQSQDAVRVVILDGLDELLQAAKVDRRAYLQEIAAFQQIEGDQQRPVAVIVTSRTVVVDRVDIPRDTAIVKLEEFDEPQMRTWLSAWASANSSAASAGAIRILTIEEALHQPELARQPLLLLMLAIYASDPNSPRLVSGLSTSALYEQILGDFARREVAKTSQHAQGTREFEAAVGDQLFRLSVAALAMFNRGKQYVRESDLQADLDAFAVGNDQGEVRTDRGTRLFGEFFFVHAAEAILLGADEVTAGAPEGRVRNETDRSYEFLHATFGEFLTARMTLEALRDAADAAYGGSRGSREPDDDFLYAILSHQALPIRRTSVTFIREMYEVLPLRERENIRRTLQALIGLHRRPHRSDRYSQYRPRVEDSVRQLAAYSANLVTLAVQFSPSRMGVPLVGNFGISVSQATEIWRSTVSLWRAGLDAESLRETLALLAYDPTALLIRRSEEAGGFRVPDDEIEYYRAIGDERQVRRERYGMASAECAVFYDNDSQWADAMISVVVASIINDVALNEYRLPPSGTHPRDIERVKLGIELLLRTRSAGLPESNIANAMEVLLNLPTPAPPDPDALLIALYFHPALLVSVAKLSDRELFKDRFQEMMFVLTAVEEQVRPDVKHQWLARRARMIGDHQLFAGHEWGFERFGRILRAITQGRGGNGATA